MTPSGDHKGLMLAIGIKPKDGGPLPPSLRSSMGGSKPTPAMPSNPPQQAGGKASREQALVVTADHHCGNCSNYDGQSMCSKVDGQFSPDDACLRYFTPSGGGDNMQEEQQEQPANAPPLG